MRGGAAYYRSISAARDSGTWSMSNVTHSGTVSGIPFIAKPQKKANKGKKMRKRKKTEQAIGRSADTSGVSGKRVSACSGGTEGRPGPAYGGRVPSRCQTWQVATCQVATCQVAACQVATCPQCLSRTQTRVRVSIATGMGWEHCTAARSPRTHRRARAAAASAASLSRPTKKKRRVSATLSKRKKSPPGARTGRKHDLPLHMDHVLHARHHELDAARDEVRASFRAARVEEHAGGLCAGEDDEVGAVCVGLVVRLRRRRRRRRA